VVRWIFDVFLYHPYGALFKRIFGVFLYSGRVYGCVEREKERGILFDEARGSFFLHDLIFLIFFFSSNFFFFFDISSLLFCLWHLFWLLNQDIRSTPDNVPFHESLQGCSTLYAGVAHRMSNFCLAVYHRWLEKKVDVNKDDPSPGHETHRLSRYSWALVTRPCER